MRSGQKKRPVCLPALVAICWWPARDSRSRLAQSVYVLLSIAVVAYIAARVWIGIGNRYLDRPSFFLIKNVVVTAFGSLASPWRSPVSMPARWLSFAAAAAMTLILGANLLHWRRTDPAFQRAVRFALWAIAAVAPVFTFFFVSPTLEGSRYVYLAACAWTLLLADAEAILSTADQRPSVKNACDFRWTGRHFVLVSGRHVE